MCIGVLLSNSACIAQTVEEKKCALQEVQFDGIAPLQYAKVVGANSEQLRLKESYWDDCGGGQSAPCGPGIQVDPGDDVAVAKSCGGWSLIQDISHTRTRVGWIRDKLLTGLKAAVPDDQGEPGGRQRPKSFTAIPGTVATRLTRGAGLSVCEAYLQRLNLTVFHEPPPCGIPENDHVPGFALLRRVPLAVAQVNALYIEAANMLGIYGKSLSPPPAGSYGVIGIIRNGLEVAVSIPPLSDSDNISVWKYAPELDPRNDGARETVIVWRNFPPVWNDTKDSQPPCGQIGFNSRDASGTPDLQVPFVLKKDASAIDEHRTLSAFDRHAETTSSLLGHSAAAPAFLPLGESTDVFQYRGQTYLNTVSAVPPLNQRPIEVFWWHLKKRELLCEYASKDVNRIWTLP